jgi:pilus assembly protein CpaF
LERQEAVPDEPGTIPETGTGHDRGVENPLDSKEPACRDRPRTSEEITRYLQSVVLARHPKLLATARISPEDRQQLKGLIAGILMEENLVVRRLTRDALSEQIVSEIVGYGPIDHLIRDPSVTEVMVNGPGQVYVEREGRLEPAEVAFRDDDHLLDLIIRIVAPLGRRLDQASPFVDARLPDGSRVNAIIAPLSLIGPVLTVRKFPDRSMTLADLVARGTMSPGMAAFLAAAVRARLNGIISGGAGAGKTTLLNALAGAIPGARERVITIEDSAELRLPQEHVVALESRPANTEGRGEVTIRHLLRNALRMRPDRLVIGECRGGEAFELLQAMNSGHSGSFSTVHANAAADALARVGNMVLMSGEDLPHQAIVDQVRSALDVVIHIDRYADGIRRVSEVALIDKAGGAGGYDRVGLKPVYAFAISGKEPGGGLTGDYVARPAIAPAWLVGKFKAVGETLPEPLLPDEETAGAAGGVVPR